jgi:hypothetical protein
LKKSVNLVGLAATAFSLSVCVRLGVLSGQNRSGKTT